MAHASKKRLRIGACSASVFLNEDTGGRIFRSVGSDLPATVPVLNLAADYFAEREAAQ